MLHKNLIFFLRQFEKYKVFFLILLILFVGIFVLGIKTKYFQYIYAKILWNKYCRKELIELNPGSTAFLKDGDGIADSIFCEWIYYIFHTQPSDVLRRDCYNDLNKLEWEPGEIYVRIGGIEFKDLSPISRLTMVTGISINETNIHELGFIKNMNKLTFLFISDTPISNIPSIKGKNLETLYILGGTMTNLDSLAGSSIKRCTILDNKDLKDISGIGSVKVKILTLDGAGIEDIGPLKDCHDLTSLSLNGCKIKDLAPLVGKDISNLYIRNTLVDDLSPLLKTMNPRNMRLDITGCPASKKALPGSLGGITL